MKLAISPTVMLAFLAASTAIEVTKNDLGLCLRDCEERFGRDEYGIGSAADHCRSICYTANRHRKSSLSSPPTRRPTSSSGNRRRPNSRPLTPTYTTPSTRHQKSSQESNGLRPTVVKNKEAIAEALKHIAADQDEVSRIASNRNLVL